MCWIRRPSRDFKASSSPREISPRLEALAFSPDSRILTSFIRGDYSPNTGGFVVSWDLQTGGVVSAIEWKGPCDANVGRAQITFSRNGKMVAVLSRYESSTIVSIYDVVSGVYTHGIDHGALANLDLALGALPVYKIWTHGESLRFTSPRHAGIAIWEVGFAPGATPTEVETVSAPDHADETFALRPKQTDILRAEFHPASCRISFIHGGTRGTLIVWDARASKFLLHHTDTHFFGSMTFSSDARFFACSTLSSEVYLWKESPSGYILLEKLTTGTRYSKPRLSPNGESIITIHYCTIRLWHTKSFSTNCRAPAQVLHTGEDFVLAFFPGRQLAAAARMEEKMITVLDLESGVSLLTIDTSIEVYGLRPIENAIAVIGDEKAIAWNLPGGNFPSDSRMTVGDSTWTINFGNVDNSAVVTASISLDSRYIVLIRHDLGCRRKFLDVYCTSTRRRLREETEIFALWFAPGEHDIWCAADDEAKVFTITQDSLNHTKTVADTDYGSWGCPWGSSCGYQVTNEWWILGAGGKRLLKLPPLWQSRFGEDRVWSGKFLAFLHGALPEPVILELEP